MKKIVLYLCAGILVLGITSCGKGGEDAGTQESGQSSEVSSVPEESGDGSSESPGRQRRGTGCGRRRLERGDGRSEAGSGRRTGGGQLLA